MVIPVKEKRQFPRISLKTPLRLQIRGLPNYKNAVTDNISAGGVGFLDSDFIAPDTPVALEINLLSKILRPFGRIAWSQNLSHTDRYRMGIEFSEMDPKEKNYLSDYIGLKTGSLGGI